MTDEDRWVYWATRFCCTPLEEARRLARERPDLVDAWNHVRREHEYRDRVKARKAAG